MLALILSHRHLDAIRASDGSGNLATDLAKKGLANSPKKTIKVADDDPDGAVFVDEVEDLLQKRKKDVFASNTKTTLIVAPLAVVEQWQREASEKTGHKLQVHVHHGASRAKTPEVLAAADVVITTYATAANEHAQYLSELPGAQEQPISLDSDTSPSDAASSDSDVPIARQSSKKIPKQPSRAPLFRIKWVRVVLGTSFAHTDEAQNIKNYRAKSSQACYELSLNAAARWCLTGTPLQNNVLELFSLIHFLRAAPFDDLSHFQEKIEAPIRSGYVPCSSSIRTRAEWGMKRLCAVLQTIMLRRTKDAEYNGQRLLQLPNRTVEVITIDFQTEDERDFYREIEKRMNAHLDTHTESGKLDMMGMLVMLLRLRQGTYSGLTKHAIIPP